MYIQQRIKKTTHQHVRTEKATHSGGFRFRSSNKDLVPFRHRPGGTCHANCVCTVRIYNVPCSSMIHAGREAQQASCTGSVHLSICLSALSESQSEDRRSPALWSTKLRTDNESRGRKVTAAPPLRPPACLVSLSCAFGGRVGKVQQKWGRRRRCESITLAKLTLTFVQSRRRANRGSQSAFCKRGNPSPRYQMFLIKAGNKQKKGPRFLLGQHGEVGTS